MYHDEITYGRERSSCRRDLCNIILCIPLCTIDTATASYEKTRRIPRYHKREATRIITDHLSNNSSHYHDISLFTPCIMSNNETRHEYNETRHQ